MKMMLLEKYSWRCQYATRDKKKGRAKGGIITKIRKEIEELNIGVESVNGVPERRIRLEEEVWRVLTVYNNGGMKDLREKLERKIGELEEERLCIGGDCNARIGKEGKKYEGGENTEMKRNSKDKEVNKEGREMLGMLEERGWEVEVGNAMGDEEGEWTYVGGRGMSVIDYVVTNRQAGERIEKFAVGGKVDSDHQPLEVILKGTMKKREDRKKRLKTIVLWDEDNIRKYKERGKETVIEGGNVEKLWANLKKRVSDKVGKKIIRIRERKVGERESRDADCKRKRKVKKRYKEWKGGKGEREEYVRERKMFRERCNKKEERYREGMVEEVRRQRQRDRETQIWGWLNKKRKTAREVDKKN